MRSVAALYEVQLEWIDKIIVILEDNLKKRDIDFVKACDEMWDIIELFLGIWEYEDDKDEIEYHEAVRKEAEESFDEMIAEMDQDEIDEILADFDNDFEEYRAYWIEDEIEELMNSEGPYNEEYGGYNNTLYVEIMRGDSFYDFENKEEMEDMLEDSKRIKKDIETQYQIAFRD